MSDLTLAASNALRSAGQYLRDLTTPTLRLGVTGLARSGKTVFITALVRNLVTGAPLPFFDASASGRVVRAYLEPQPDLAVPRFAYEDHLAALAKEPSDWPEGTRRIAELRVTVEYLPASALLARFGLRRLHIDIVDYPGEWLIDLALLDLDFAAWSERVLAAARQPGRSAAATTFLAFLDRLDTADGADEPLAIRGAALWTAVIEAERALSPTPTLGPGRFLLPGDLAGSPLLTFFPLPATEPAGARPTLARLNATRYEAYKAQVVKPFFREHFARLDRQIVLVDALAAVDAGAQALDELEATLGAVLDCFRPGAQSWLSAILPRRIDRILFAASKADHLHHTAHDRLEAILSDLTRAARTRASFAGAEVKALALAALRSTREAEMTRGPERLACIVGTPLPGERLGGEVFDGRRARAIFPGDLPPSLAAARAPERRQRLAEGLSVVRFRPTRVPPDGLAGDAAPWPHIRLDRALEFLIGDYLQ